ncbi:MAG TPA: LysM peptidoglycan-binding domain-containing protein [Anaerolineaceae bacterium]
MKPKTYLIVAAFLILALLLPACERSVSKPPAAVPSPTPEVPFPVSTKVTNLATQTAAAAKGVTPPAAATKPAGVTDATATPGKPAVATTTPAAPQVQPTQAQQVQPTKAPEPQQPPKEEPSGNEPETRPATWTIQKGEHLYCIARRYDLDPASFFALNGMNANSQPPVGTVLKIPSTGTWSTARYGSRSLRAHPTTYSVRAGDTVYSVACLYGDVTPDAILKANGLSSPGDVKAGMTLNIP